MWIRVALVVLLALPWVAPAGAASAPTDRLLGDAVAMGPVEVTAGPGGSTAVRSGRPAIDLRQGSAGGLAPGTVVVIGDPDDPRRDHAFAVTNGGEAEFVVSLRYEYDRDPPGEAGVSFAAYDASGARLADGRESMAVTLAPGQTAYVTVTINTHGTTPQDDLSGSLALRAVGPDRPAQ